jgi:hypothetical protein
LQIANCTTSLGFFSLAFVTAATSCTQTLDTLTDTYTGIHTHGGPTTIDHAITLSNLADRSSADVRGTKLDAAVSTAVNSHTKYM